MQPSYKSALLDPINKAGMDMGYNVVDANGCQQTGKNLCFVTSYEKTIKNYVSLYICNNICSRVCGHIA